MDTRVSPAGPRRVQRQRTKGWRMPENTVYVGRRSRWGNPFAVGDPLTKHFAGASELSGEVRDASHAVELYDLHTGPMGNYEIDDSEIRASLAGKNLACWCPEGAACHADVLLRIANSEPA